MLTACGLGTSRRWPRRPRRSPWRGNRPPSRGVFHRKCVSPAWARVGQPSRGDLLHPTTTDHRRSPGPETRPSISHICAAGHGRWPPDSGATTTPTGPATPTRPGRTRQSAVLTGGSLVTAAPTSTAHNRVVASCRVIRARSRASLLDRVSRAAASGRSRCRARTELSLLTLVMAPWASSNPRGSPTRT